MRRKSRGFTLIEMLVVVAIIALLLAILLPSLSRVREKSKTTICAPTCGKSASLFILLRTCMKAARRGRIRSPDLRPLPVPSICPSPSTHKAPAASRGTMFSTLKFCIAILTAPARTISAGSPVSDLNCPNFVEPANSTPGIGRCVLMKTPPAAPAQLQRRLPLGRPVRKSRQSRLLHHHRQL